MAKVQYDGIKYPFEVKNDENYFVDLNKTMRESVRSQMLHVIFTPKGQKIRDPEFGTNLVKYIFDQNDGASWSNVRSEINASVSTYVPNVIINEINVLKSEEIEGEIFVRIDYSVKEGNLLTKDTVITKI